jgi:transcriptional regulator with XRE-family HTH domain
MTLPRAEYEALIERLEEAEDLAALAAAAGVSPSYLSEIEGRRKPGSFMALAKLAAALDVALDDVAAWLAPRNQ